MLFLKLVWHGKARKLCSMFFLKIGVNFYCSFWVLLGLINTRKLVFDLRHFFCQDFQHKYINQVIKEGFQVILLLRSDFTQLEKNLKCLAR